MKISCITSVYGERGKIRDIESIIQAAARIGLDAIELFAEKNLGDRIRHAGLNTTDEEIEKTRKLADQYQLHISSICAHFSLIQDDKKERELSLREYKKCIDQAVVLGTDFVHGFSGIPEPQMAHDENFLWRVFCEGACEILDYAGSRNIQFGMEPVIHHLVHSLGTLDQMFERMKRDDLFINYDPVHLYLSGAQGDPVATIRKYGHKIKHVHVHDGHGPGSFHWDQFVQTLKQEWNNFDPPGMGELNWGAILVELKKAGFDGYLSLEHIGDGYTPIDYIVWNYRNMMQNLSQ